MNRLVVEFEGRPVRVVYQPIRTGALDPMDVARFAARADISGGLFACWPWTGARQGNEYGRTAYRGGSVTAHRFSLELALGRPIAPGMYALHSCDNRGCVNPRHLREGTPQDNVDDMVTRGRHFQPPHAAGEANGWARLTPDLVREIRSRFAAGDSKRHLSLALGISRTAVRRVVNRETWGHVS